MNDPSFKADRRAADDAIDGSVSFVDALAFYVVFMLARLLRRSFLPSFSSRVIFHH